MRSSAYARCSTSRAAWYWNVFDEKGKDGFSITLAGYENLGDVRRLVYETPGVVLKSGFS